MGRSERGWGEEGECICKTDIVRVWGGGKGVAGGYITQNLYVGHTCFSSYAVTRGHS